VFSEEGDMSIPSKKDIELLKSKPKKTTGLHNNIVG